MTRFIGVDEAAYIMGVSTRSVYSRVRTGILECAGRNPTVFTEDMLEAFLERDRRTIAYQTPKERDGWALLSARKRERERLRHKRALEMRRLYPGVRKKSA